MLCVAPVRPTELDRSQVALSASSHPMQLPVYSRNCSTGGFAGSLAATRASRPLAGRNRSPPTRRSRPHFLLKTSKLESATNVIRIILAAQNKTNAQFISTYVTNDGTGRDGRTDGEPTAGAGDQEAKAFLPQPGNGKSGRREASSPQDHVPYTASEG